MDLLQTRNGRRFLFASLYLSEGAPVGYLWWAVPTRLAADGLATEAIAAFIAPLVLPWSLKFLWAPAVDVLQSQRWGLRAWIVAAQLMMGLTLLPAILVSSSSPRLLGTIFLVHAFFAATQDVAVDALCIRSTPADEEGSINGWMQLGYLGGRALFGGAILQFESAVLVGWLGFSTGAAEAITIVALVGVIWWSMSLVIFATRPSERETRGGRNLGAVLSILGDVFSRRSTYLAFGFALTGAAAFEAVGAVARPLLVSELAFSEASVGTFSVVTVAAMAAGALGGGLVADRLGRRRLVMIATVLIGLLVIAIGVLLTSAAAGRTVPGALVLLYALIGTFTASSYGLFMNLTEPELGGTQFSAFMGATNLCEAWSVAAIGRLTGWLDYPQSFAIMAAVSVLSIAFVFPMRDPRTGTG